MKILNFGSLNIDHVYGVPHHARTGETLTCAQYQRHLGGKGLNQSVALARAGALVYHAGNIGADGLFLKDYLQANGVNTRHVRTLEAATGHAIIQVNPAGDNCILLYPGANRMADGAQIDEALSGFGAGDMLLVQNETNGLDRLLRGAKARGMRTAINPSPMDEAVMALPLELCDTFLLNEIEGTALTGADDPETMASRLAARYPRACIVLTLGGAGSVYIHGDTRIRQPIYPVRAVDTTGAGDTFTGYFLASQLRGEDAARSMRLAAMAAALAVSRPGAAQSIPLLSQTEDALGGEE